VGPLIGTGVIIIVGILVALFLHATKCKHAWEFVDKTELPSKIEEAKKNGVDVNDLWDSQIEEMSEKKVVIVLRCPKCGTPKIYSETN
jgi:hypothetical protein